MESNFITLPVDILYNIALALAGKNVSIKDKINNYKQIIRMCKINKRFNQLYCKEDRIWRELWIRDISEDIVPTENIRKKYLETLYRANDWNMAGNLQFAGDRGYLQLAEILLNQPEATFDVIREAYFGLKPNAPLLDYFVMVIKGK